MHNPITDKILRKKAHTEVGPCIAATLVTGNSSFEVFLRCFELPSTETVKAKLVPLHSIIWIFCYGLIEKE
jgi:hypothetical protein